MLKTMLRERLPSAAFAFIMVVSIAFIYLYTSSAEAFKWNVYEQKYVSKMTADEFLTQYPADYESARNKFFSIHLNTVARMRTAVVIIIPSP